MAELFYGVDDATPPSANELGALIADGVRFCGVYVGGINNGGRAWTPADAALLRQIGILGLPIYVGENVCDGCGTPIVLTDAQGATDGRQACQDAAMFGYKEGPIMLDLEGATTQLPLVSWQPYAQAWTKSVTEGAYFPVLYMPRLAAAAYTPVVPTGLLMALWDGVATLDAIPNPGNWHGLGKQYTDNWHGFDGDVADGTWWNMVSTVPKGDITFSNGFKSQGGMYQYWSHNGGMVAFGMAISQEYHVTVNGKDVTRQWYERAILERVAGQWPQEWDIEGVRLGSMLANRATGIGVYVADVTTHASAFKP